jgi:hypothetical protein
MYFNFCIRSTPSLKVASHGVDPSLVPPIAQLVSDAQANVGAVVAATLKADFTFQVRPSVVVRTMCHVDVPSASPTQTSFRQVNDVSVAHAEVAPDVRSVHVAPPSRVA